MVVDSHSATIKGYALALVAVLAILTVATIVGKNSPTIAASVAMILTALMLRYVYEHPKLRGDAQ